MAQFNDTTNGNGLIQRCEFWTRQPATTISGNSALLKLFTDRINAAYERITPILIAANDQIRWDDTNHGDQPVATFNLVASQNDYKITADDNSLDILNITHVRILPTSTATIYTELERINSDDPRITEIISPASNVTGTPSGFVELGNAIYLDCKPSYSATSGIQVFFSRIHDYFTTSDTTQEPGFPQPFHEVLALYAALDWSRINRADDISLLRELKEEIAKQEAGLRVFIGMTNPTKARMTIKPANFI